LAGCDGSTFDSDVLCVSIHLETTHIVDDDDDDAASGSQSTAFVHTPVMDRDAAATRTDSAVTGKVIADVGYSPVSTTSSSSLPHKPAAAASVSLMDPRYPPIK